MTKSYQKSKDTTKNPNAGGPHFRTPVEIKSGGFNKQFGGGQTFNPRPVNVVRHKG